MELVIRLNNPECTLSPLEPVFTISPEQKNVCYVVEGLHGNRFQFGFICLYDTNRIHRLVASTKPSFIISPFEHVCSLYKIPCINPKNTQTITSHEDNEEMIIYIMHNPENDTERAYALSMLSHIPLATAMERLKQNQSEYDRAKQYVSSVSFTCRYATCHGNVGKTRSRM